MIITTGSSQVDVVEDHPITAICVIDDNFIAFATSKGKIYVSEDTSFKSRNAIGIYGIVSLLVRTEV